MISKIGSFLHSFVDRITPWLTNIRNNRKYSLLINGVLFVMVGIFLTNYILKEWQTIKEFRVHFAIVPLVISFILYGVNYVLFLFGWHILIKSYGVKSSIFTNSYIYSYSQIAKILPTPAWFITGRLVLYQKEGAQKRIILTSTFLEIILHMIVGLVFMALINITSENYFSWLYGLSIIPLVIFILFPKILNFSFLKLNDSSFKKFDFLVLIALFALTWILSGPFFQSLLSGIGISTEISMIKLWQIWIISSIFAYIGSLTLGGVGILREFSITFLLGNLISPPLAAIIAAVSRIIMTLGNLVWPLIIMGIVRIIKKTGKVEEENQAFPTEKDPS